MAHWDLTAVDQEEETLFWVDPLDGYGIKVPRV